jgi:23S rRNA (adenine-N6)-dimethyltransferase
VAVGRRPARGSPGQHFLRSKRLAGDLVAEADLAQGDLVIEIGGGTGVLTHALAQSSARVLVLERDPALVALLRERFGSGAAVSVVQSDAAEYVWPSEPFAVVANLPFARSGAILASLLRDPGTPLRRAHVILQWEFAAKHTSVCPATLRATYWRAWYDVSIARRLDRSAFAPPPSVDAAVVRLERRARPLLPLESHVAYWSFLRAAFETQQPIRRSLRRSLSPLEIKRLAPALGFAREARASQLDAEQWAKLFAFARGLETG